VHFAVLLFLVTQKPVRWQWSSLCIKWKSPGLEHFSCGPLTCKHQDLLKLRFVISSAAITVAISKKEMQFIRINRMAYTLAGVRKCTASLKYQNNQHGLNASLTVE